MTLLWLSAIWVLASAAVAMLPIRHQSIPGVALLGAAPVLVVAITVQAGWIIGMLARAAAGSMYRNPLRYIWASLRGKPFEVPE